MPGLVVPYALSVHSFVDKVGGYAGLAAVLAVALLVIMFFVNARETSALRDRAEEAEERLYRLEYHAEAVSRNAAAQQQRQPAAAQAAADQATQAVPVTPAPAGAGATVVRPGIAPAPAAAAQAISSPVAPAGVGAPALASATRLIPRARPEPEAAPPPATAVAAAAPLASATASGPAGNGASGVPPAPAPSTAAGGGAPASQPAVAPPPRLAPRPAPSATAPRRNYGRENDKGASRVGKGSIAVATVLLAVIVAAAVLVITHHSSSSGNGGSGRTHRAVAKVTHAKTSSSPTRKTSGTVRVNPASVTVAVLNGTSTTNLAADVLSKLQNAGFQPGATGNNPDQTETSTTVGYLPGNRIEALAVARSLKVSPSEVKPVDVNSREVVCSTPSACPDQVVVIVGADLESDA